VSEIDPVENGGLSAAPGAPRATEREGLPPGYRMRAESHYVDQLVTRRAEAPAVSEPARAASGPDLARTPARRPDRPDVVTADKGDRTDRPADRAFESLVQASEPHPIDGPGLRSLFDQLIEDLATIESATGLLSGASSAMARRTSLDLIKAHAWRASWLVRAHAVLESSEVLPTRPRELGQFLNQVREGLAAECRLSGVALQIHPSDWNALVAVDESAVVTGLTGAVLATLGLVQGAQANAIRVNAVALAGELHTLEITQDDVTVPPHVSQRFFDASWHDHPGGWTAGLGASVAKAVALRHGGDAGFLVGARRGSTLRMRLTRHTAD